MDVNRFYGGILGDSRDIKISIKELLHGKLPIIQAMVVRVEDYDGQQLVWSTPSAQNLSHLETAFGGNLNTHTVLSD